MPVTLSIKNAPDDIVATLKARAARNHRSLQGELLSILGDVAKAEMFLRPMTPLQVAELAAQLGPRSPSSVDMIREDRDR